MMVWRPYHPLLTLSYDVQGTMWVSMATGGWTNDDIDDDVDDVVVLEDGW